MDFTNHTPTHLNNQIQSAAQKKIEKQFMRLVELSTYKNSIDFPYCTECAGYVSEELNNMISTVEKDTQAYSQFNDQLQEEFPFCQQQIQALKKEIEEIKQEKDQLVSATLKKKEEQLSLQQKLNVLNESKIKMKKLEQDYWYTYGMICSHRERIHDEIQSLTGRLDYSFDRLERARRTYVLNDVFYIWHNGHYGTINNYRLERIVSSQPIEHNEINAAWGMTVMLIELIARALDYDFVDVRLLLMGCQSKVKILKDDAEYELYADRDSPLRFLWAHRYDRAMHGVLDCVGQLLDHLTAIDSEFRVPYEIVGKKIGVQAIKFNPEDKWTKALKFLLTDIKFIVAWMAGRGLQLKPTTKVLKTPL